MVRRVHSPYFLHAVIPSGGCKIEEVIDSRFPVFLAGMRAMDEQKREGIGSCRTCVRDRISLRCSEKTVRGSQIEDKGL